MTPCPFCGDDREPHHEPVSIGDGGPEVHRMVCLCCGAEGPLAKTKEAAITLWNRRWPAGQSAAWRKFYTSET